MLFPQGSHSRQISQAFPNRSTGSSALAASSVIYQVEDRVEDMFFALKVVPLCEPFIDEIYGTAALLRRLKHRLGIPFGFEHLTAVTCMLEFAGTDNGFLFKLPPFTPTSQFQIGWTVHWGGGSVSTNGRKGVQFKWGRFTISPFSVLPFPSSRRSACQGPARKP